MKCDEVRMLCVLGLCFGRALCCQLRAQVLYRSHDMNRISSHFCLHEPCLSVVSAAVVYTHTFTIQNHSQNDAVASLGSLYCSVHTPQRSQDFSLRVGVALLSTSACCKRSVLEAQAIAKCSCCASCDIRSILSEVRVSRAPDAALARQPRPRPLFSSTRTPRQPW